MACGPKAQQIEISAKPVDKPVLILPSADEINMRSVEWIIINEENLEQKIADITSNGQPLALFVLSADGYENLSLNLGDIRKLVQQQQQIILAYERYYQNIAQ